MKSTNFEFLRPGNELLANLGGLAEAIQKQSRSGIIRLSSLKTLSRISKLSVILCRSKNI